MNTKRLSGFCGQHGTPDAAERNQCVPGDLPCPVVAPAATRCGSLLTRLRVNAR